MLQSRTKLLEKVFLIMSTFLRNKTISKTTPLREENPFPRFNVASHKRPGIRLSFEYTTTLLSGEGGEGRTGTATMFRKKLSKYTIFSTVLSKIVDTLLFSPISCFVDWLLAQGQGLRMCTTLANLGRTKTNVTISFFCIKKKKKDYLHIAQSKEGEDRMKGTERASPIHALFHR